MISLEELKGKAKIKGLSLGNAEKDYLIDLVLLSISKNTKDELVFKGGTCLYKFYNLGRFSEDADFTAIKPVNVDKLAEDIISDLKQFNVNCKLHRKKEPFNSVLLTIRCEGPLFRGTPMKYSNVRIDINFKSSINIEPLLRNFSSTYQEIPPFSLLIMQENEIAAEKIRAIMTRNKVRDLYDLWSIIVKGTEVDKIIVSKKLEYYNTHFDYDEFSKILDKKKALWEKDLKLLIRNLPDFNEVKSFILKEAKKWKFQKKRQ